MVYLLDLFPAWCHMSRVAPPLAIRWCSPLPGNLTSKPFYGVRPTALVGSDILINCSITVASFAKWCMTLLFGLPQSASTFWLAGDLSNTLYIFLYISRRFLFYTPNARQTMQSLFAISGGSEFGVRGSASSAFVNEEKERKKEKKNRAKRWSE